MSILDKVDKAGKHPIGITSEEIDVLLEEEFPLLTRKDFDEAFGRGHTCAVIDDVVYMYHCDVSRALWVAMKRKVKGVL